MEELLNKLIEKGWKPRWFECVEDNGKSIRYHKRRIWFYHKKEYKLWAERPEEDYTLRWLVSKESWLWQFVCENGMIKTYMNIEHESRRHSDKNHKPVWAFDNQSYYYLIESALCDEDKLEDFILKNVKIDEEE